MSDVRAQAEALRDRCEELARQAEREIFDMELTPDERAAAQDRAKVYWQMSRNHTDTVVNAADDKPLKFTGRNKGAQGKTKARIEFLKRVKDATGSAKRQDIALAAWDDPERAEHFDDYDSLYRFLGRHKD